MMMSTKSIIEPDKFESNDSIEANKLRKAIWDMMNFANMYVIVLDEKMNIKFVNYSLYNDLGFTQHNEILGKCWLDFIKIEDKSNLISVHSSFSGGNGGDKRFIEYTNEIVSITGNILSVKWFNAHINTEYNWTFSIGIQSEKPVMITAESVRKYYKQVLENDRTMIMALRDTIINDNKKTASCDLEK